VDICTVHAVFYARLLAVNAVIWASSTTVKENICILTAGQWF